MLDWLARREARLLRKYQVTASNKPQVLQVHALYGIPAETSSPRVIPPLLAEARSGVQATRASFCFGVMPAKAMFGRSWLQIHSHRVPNDPGLPQYFMPATPVPTQLYFLWPSSYKEGVI
jgi:hypothetical protein